MLSTICASEITERPISGFIKVVMMATYASMLLIAGTGTAMVLVRPPSGDAIDSAVGAITGIPGIAAAVLGTFSIALLLHRRQSN
jgi:hypothetical protein